MINTGNEGVPHEQESRAQNSDTLDLEKLAANWNNNDQAKKSIRDEMMKQEVLTRLDKITMLMAADSKKSSATPDPVSYTHLDVYKRQVLGCALLGHTVRLNKVSQSETFDDMTEKSTKGCADSDHWQKDLETASILSSGTTI